MKKLTLLAVAGTFGLFSLSASAKLASGLESVNLKATVLTENGAKVVKTKITTDDILSLIDNEYGTSYAKQDGGTGYQLVSYGVGYDYGAGYDIFAVADKTGAVVLENASFDLSADYALYLQPYNDETWVRSYNGTKDIYTVPSVEVFYRSADDFDSFNVSGLMTDKVDWSTYDENYSVKNGQGSIYFEDEGIYGPIMGASVSGSGIDVDPFDD